MARFASLMVVSTSTVNADTCSDARLACFGSDTNCRNYADVVSKCGQNAVCKYSADAKVDICHTNPGESSALETETADTCSAARLACFGSDTNCRNYADVVAKCGQNAVCRYDDDAKVDICHRAGGETALKTENQDTCSVARLACFGSDTNCRNYPDVVAKCGENAYCAYDDDAKVDICHRAGGDQDTCSAARLACFGSDTNCRNYQDVIDKCGQNAYCAYDDDAKVDICHRAGGEAAALKTENQDTCSVARLACFGSDTNCRNYQDVIDKCGQNAYCAYDDDAKVDICHRAGGEAATLKTENQDTCSVARLACFGSDTNCRNYQDVIDKCGQNAYCAYDDDAKVDICHRAGVSMMV